MKILLLRDQSLKHIVKRSFINSTVFQGGQFDLSKRLSERRMQPKQAAK